VVSLALSLGGSSNGGAVCESLGAGFAPFLSATLADDVPKTRRSATERVEALLALTIVMTRWDIDDAALVFVEHCVALLATEFGGESAAEFAAATVDCYIELV
jgi:hypothetical protein